MASDWGEISLAAVMDVKHGFAFPGANIRDEPPGDILLTPGNFAIGGGFKGDKFKYFDGAVPDDYVLNEGDLVVTMTDLSKQADTLGYPALVPKLRGPRFLHNQRLGKVLIKRGAELDKGFLFYLLRTAEYRDEVLASATGTTVKHTSPGRILAHKATLPPIAEQRAIANILGVLDDKIELNRRMNETLEGLARAIFQSWFVDFDPVRAQRDGLPPPALSPTTAALFPDSFEDSELGKIPMGWKVAKLEEVAAIQGGKQLPTEDCVSVEKYVVFGANGIMGYTQRATHEGFVIAFGRVGAYCGSIHWSYNSAWINNNGSAVVPTKWDEYVLQSMLHFDFTSMRTGSAQPFIPNGSLATAPVIIPGPKIAEAFCRVVHPLRLKQSANELQSQQLAAIRDALLPKLLSGEIRVAEAERLVERV